MLVTIGLIAKYTGLKLALLLGAESVVLFTLGSARRSLVLQIGSYLSGALAVGYGIDGLERDDMHGLLMETAVGSLMVFNAFWSHRQLSANKNPMRPVPAFFSLLALITCFAATWYNTSSENLPLVLAAEALVFSLSVYLIGVRELSLLGQAYLLLAHGTWLFRYFDSNSTPPWWNPLLVIAITVALTHWRQRQRTVPCPQPHVVWQSLYALAVMMVLYLWLEPLNRPADWLTMTSLIALAITVYGVFTRAWMLAACAQIFLFISIGQFALQLANEKPAWHFPLAPVAVLGTLSFATVKWFQKSPDASEEIRDPLLQLAMIYRWMALAMSLWWISEYIPAKERIWVSAFIGLLIFLWAGWRRNSEALLFSAAFTLFGFGMFWVPLHEAPTVYLPNLFAILALLAQQRLAKNFSERYKLDAAIHGAAIVLGGLTLWLLLHRWLRESAGTFYLTAAWSALALVLFGCGMLWRERVYRWVGLGVLATALGRVFIFDVWKLDTIYRVLSFMALGIVLLVLGFIYNKYQEKIKEWL